MTLCPQNKKNVKDYENYKLFVKDFGSHFSLREHIVRAVQ